MAKSFSIKYSIVPPCSSISDLIHSQLDTILRPTYKPEETSRAERSRIDHENIAKLYGYYSPAKPFPIPGKGYPYLDVFFDDFRVWFTSTHEIDHFCNVFSEKILPSARNLADRFDFGLVNRVWISRFPKPKLKNRLEIIEYISRIDKEFRQIAGDRQKVAKESLKYGKLVPKLGNISKRYLHPPFDV